MEDLYLVLAKLDPELGTAQPQLNFSLIIALLVARLYRVGPAHLNRPGAWL